MSLERTTVTVDVCPPVSGVFGGGTDALEIMGWPEAADDVRNVATDVVATYGSGEAGKGPEQNALNRACGTCALGPDCLVSTEIAARADIRQEEVPDPTMDELVYTPETRPFMQMPKIEALRDLRRGEELYFPKGELPSVITTEDTVLPSLDITTPLGREVTLAPLYAASDKLYNMWASTVLAQSPRDRDYGISRRIQELLIRVTDTDGSHGVHHINDTELPQTIYYTLDSRPGRPTVYLTPLGKIRGRPTYGVLTATSTSKEQLDLIKTVGGSTNRKRFRG